MTATLHIDTTPPVPTAVEMATAHGYVHALAHAASRRSDPCGKGFAALAELLALLMSSAPLPRRQAVAASVELARLSAVVETCPERHQPSPEVLDALRVVAAHLRHLARRQQLVPALGKQSTGTGAAENRSSAAPPHDQPHGCTRGEADEPAPPDRSHGPASPVTTGEALSTDTAVSTTSDKPVATLGLCLSPSSGTVPPDTAAGRSSLPPENTTPAAVPSRAFPAIPPAPADHRAEGSLLPRGSSTWWSLAVWAVLLAAAVWWSGDPRGAPELRTWVGCVVEHAAPRWCLDVVGDVHGAGNMHGGER